MKKTIAIILMASACGVAAYGAYLAWRGGESYLADINGSSPLRPMLEALALMCCGWVLFGVGVRVLAGAAHSDAKARELLASVLVVFDRVPAPEGVRRKLAKITGVERVRWLW